MKLLNKYPIDTRANMVKAAQYFEDYYKQFPTSDRIKFSNGLMPELKKNNLPHGEKLAHYYNPKVRKNYEEASIKVREYMTGGLHNEELVTIAKVAHIVSPQEFVTLLDEFDNAHNLQNSYGRMPDPFDSVFLSEKVAEELSGDCSWTSSTGDMITKFKLHDWVNNSDAKEQLSKKFGEDLALGLCSSSCWEIFSSLPEPHKKVIARMVNENVINGTSSPGVSRFATAGSREEEELYTSPSKRIMKLLER